VCWKKPYCGLNTATWKLIALGLATSAESTSCDSDEELHRCRWWVLPPGRELA
jgi:hypothetical protein